MGDYIYLQGSETVYDASYKMQSAASEMLRAANTIEDATSRLERFLGQGHGTNLELLIEALNNHTQANATLIARNLKPTE
jgi:hypothetical protein